MLEDVKPATAKEVLSDVSPEIESATLRRLIEEVRMASIEPTAYNRMHNRHNRS